MPVYVDDAKNPFGRMIMCHMLADTTEELLVMAKKVGLDAKHIQHAGTANEHFELSKSYREKAVKAGAKEVNSRELVQIIRRRRAYLASIADVHTPPAPEDIPDMDEADAALSEFEAVGGKTMEEIETETLPERGAALGWRRGGASCRHRSASRWSTRARCSL